MRVDNQTSDPVDWEQTGGSGPMPEEYAAQTAGKSGELQSDSDTGDFVPAGTAPYSVRFTDEDGKHQPVDSCKFSDAGATVTLNSDWTVSVSTGCD